MNDTTSALPHEEVPPPSERFNFAEHLLSLNRAHPQRAAFVDDAGTLSYGDLARRIGQMSAALRGLGLRREERVLLLMHDCSDWPVTFLAPSMPVWCRWR